MKAAIVEQPGVLVVRDVPAPEPGEYDVLCQLLYGATCSGTDQHIIHNRFPWGIKYPTILGHESIGRAVKVGKKVRNFRVGDLITRVGTPPAGGCQVNWGGFAEFGLARDHWAMREDGQPQHLWAPYRVNQKLPRGADPIASTMVITWRETLSNISRMGVGNGARVLVLGSGGNGLAFANHARNLGAAYIAMAGSAGREANAKAVGVELYLDYRREDLAAAMKAAGGTGFDYLIDAVGKAGEINRVMSLLKPGGMCCIYGIDERQKCFLNPFAAPGSFTYYNGGYDEAETHDRVMQFIGERRLDAAPYLALDRIFALEDIAAAFAAIKARELVKAVIRLSPAK